MSEATMRKGQRYRVQDKDGNVCTGIYLGGLQESEERGYLLFKISEAGAQIFIQAVRASMITAVESAS